MTNRGFNFLVIIKETKKKFLLSPKTENGLFNSIESKLGFKASMLSMTTRGSDIYALWYNKERIGKVIKIRYKDGKKI